jgi:hypothetical protein
MKENYKPLKNQPKTPRNPAARRREAKAAEAVPDQPPPSLTPLLVI